MVKRGVIGYVYWIKKVVIMCIRGLFRGMWLKLKINYFVVIRCV